MHCKEFRSLLLGWFGESLECHQESPDSLIVVLPLAKPNGDFVELGVRAVDGDWRISDLGDTHEALYLAGVDIIEDSDRRDEFVQIVSDHGIADTGSELYRFANQDLAEVLFDFATAINSVLALQLTVPTKSPSRDFSNVVAKFLAEQRTSFEIPTERVLGKSGSWKFQFSLNHVRPETLVKTVTASTVTAAMKQSQTTVFEVEDVRGVNSAVSAVVILDDEGDREDIWKARVMRVFQGYNVPAIPFTAGRDQLLALTRQYALGK